MCMGRNRASACLHKMLIRTYQHFVLGGRSGSR
jgi:hypothetical protein